MEKKGNDLQEELRSSQVYKMLTGSGIPVAGKIAQGLGKAAQGLDQALNLKGNATQGRNAGHPYQAPPPRGITRPGLRMAITITAMPTGSSPGSPRFPGIRRSGRRRPTARPLPSTLPGSRRQPPRRRSAPTGRPSLPPACP